MKSDEEMNSLIDTTAILFALSSFDFFFVVPQQQHSVNTAIDVPCLNLKQVAIMQGFGLQLRDSLK